MVAIEGPRFAAVLAAAISGLAAAAGAGSELAARQISASSSNLVDFWPRPRDRDVPRRLQPRRRLERSDAGRHRTLQADARDATSSRLDAIDMTGATLQDRNDVALMRAFVVTQRRAVRGSGSGKGSVRTAAHGAGRHFHDDPS